MTQSQLAAKHGVVHDASRQLPSARRPSEIVRGFLCRPLGLGVSGGLLLWASFPPLGWWPLAWIASLPWLWLIRQPGPTPGLLRELYLAGVMVWLLLVQWIRLPHWSAYFGWLALAIYLGCYLPAFIGVSRLLVHRYRWPLPWAAAVAWTALEYARGHLLTGFAMLLLAHSQKPCLTLIQCADISGAYGLGFVMMFVSACWMLALSPEAIRRRITYGVLSIAALVAVGLYGALRLNAGQQLATATSARDGTGQGLKVALIQGSIDTRFDDPTHPWDYHLRYLQLSREALRAEPAIQLLIWPESIFWQFAEPVAGYDTEQLTKLSVDQYLKLVADAGDLTASWMARELNVPMIVGCQEYDVVDDRLLRFNSVWLIDQTGKRSTRYNKMHPVMFGEYVPLGSVFPWLYKLTPMEEGLTAGREPVCMSVGGIRFSPCICFENSVPHLIRRQVQTLVSRGESPDVLITVTNDGWFWGSSLLDYHLVCGVFRAVELRRPMLIAANTGFSAWIDPLGRIRQQGPRRAEGNVLADVTRKETAETLYLAWGDTFPATCLILCIIVIVRSIVTHRPQNEP